jgi:transcriptional regulator with XRE-family HTH domain
VLSEKIKFHMKKTGIGNKKLSEITGIPLGTLNNILYGKVTDPTIDKVRLIAYALGCTLDDFAESSTDEWRKDADAPYYADAEADARAEEAHKKHGLLFSATKDLTKEDIDILISMAERMKKTNPDVE